MLKKYIFWLLFMFACNNGSHNENMHKIENSKTTEFINAKTGQELLPKDTAIVSYLKAFNEIQGNLESIKSKEKIITVNYSQNELLPQKKDMIINDIKFIYSLLNKNKKMVVVIKKQLDDSKLRNTEINKMNINFLYLTDD